MRLKECNMNRFSGNCLTDGGALESGKRRGGRRTERGGGGRWKSWLRASRLRRNPIEAHIKLTLKWAEGSV